ncbi:MAG: bifunctional phosphopantothenoylcysteine decarboxylase/phosphopantothenate synthase [Clostridiales bacterium]|jgi:phosphopantothenoylcysteine decarboxylase/phosphopantothenate--cysteine ligase|nr:bifunctional phosphopantothenoylcysteine decarboxylase/phosphopantothenate synthase [Clostridiales bacterium]
MNSTILSKYNLDQSINRNVLVGVCGGIAAYKACDVVSELIKVGCNVQVVMTTSATQFVSPLVLATLSRRSVSVQSDGLEHIEYAKWADIVVVVPATYNTIAKIAHGIADNLLTCTIAATKSQVLIAPAMNTQMYKNLIYQHNQDKLVLFGYKFVLPDSGRLACGDDGIGKLATLQNIVQSIVDNLVGSGHNIIQPKLGVAQKLPNTVPNDTAVPFRQYIDQLKRDIDTQSHTASTCKVVNDSVTHGDTQQYNTARLDAADLLAQIKKLKEDLHTKTQHKLESVDLYNMQDQVRQDQDLVGKTVLVTAGATIQHIDPVRYISNHSSGKMGLAIADCVHRRGGNVIFVHGNMLIQPNPKYFNIRVETTQDMYDTVMSQLYAIDIFIMAAAPADYDTMDNATHKFKSQELTLSLKKTVDIAKQVGKIKLEHQKLVIFSAESQDLLVNSRIKLVTKRADLVVANDITQSGAGFGADTNIVTLISNKQETTLPLMSKHEVADKILDCIIAL